MGNKEELKQVKGKEFSFVPSFLAFEANLTLPKLLNPKMQEDLKREFGQEFMIAIIWLARASRSRSMSRTKGQPLKASMQVCTSTQRSCKLCLW
jgi:hypothetical protein